MWSYTTNIPANYVSNISLLVNIYNMATIRNFEVVPAKLTYVTISSVRILLFY